MIVVCNQKYFWLFRLLSITAYPIKNQLGEDTVPLWEVVEVKPPDQPIELAHYLHHYNPQVFLVDLELDLIPVAETINNNVMWVGITNSYRKAYRALKDGFFDVLIKPLPIAAITTVLGEIRQKLLAQDKPITISCPKEIRYLRSGSIWYIKADNNYVIVHLNDGEQFTVFNSLSYFEEILRFPFVRIHKSYIVNAIHIYRIHYTKKFLKLKGCEQFIPYTTSYAHQLEIIHTLKGSNIM